MKKVMISEELFCELVKYHCLGFEENQEQIKNQLNEKLEAMIKRELYTRYKTDPDPAEQEKARIEYLDRVGMKKDYRW